MNLENSDSSLGVGRRELDFTVDTSWTQESGIENVYTVSGHDNLN